MAEYIELEALLALMDDNRPTNWTDSDAEIQAENDYRFYRDMACVIPALDIVWCKDCEHFEPQFFAAGVGWCNKMERGMREYGFCNMGKRCDKNGNV